MRVIDSIVNKASFEGALNTGTGGDTAAYTPTVPIITKVRMRAKKPILTPVIFIFSIFYSPIIARMWTSFRLGCQCI